MSVSPWCGLLLTLLTLRSFLPFGRPLLALVQTLASALCLPFLCGGTTLALAGEDCVGQRESQGYVECTKQFV